MKLPEQLPIRRIQRPERSARGNQDMTSNHQRRSLYFFRHIKCPIHRTRAPVKRLYGAAMHGYKERLALQGGGRICQVVPNVYAPDNCSTCLIERVEIPVGAGDIDHPKTGHGGREDWAKFLRPGELARQYMGLYQRIYIACMPGIIAKHRPIAAARTLKQRSRNHLVMLRNRGRLRGGGITTGSQDTNTSQGQQYQS